MRDALYPLPPRIRLRVGVSGHRPPKLTADSEVTVRAAVDGILATIAAAARDLAKDYAALTGAETNPAGEFVVVSSLAEGADRIVAEAGLAAGYKLEAVLPFDRAEYARDFATAESRASFERLLGRASSVFELNGAADARARAYEAAGFIMLANVDLLVAIWDGAEAAGIGGTAQIVGRAIAGGIPTVWIDPAKPTAMRLAWPREQEIPLANARPEDAFRSAEEGDVARAIGDIVAAPTETAAKQSLQRYLAERERRWNFCWWYPLLLQVFAGRPMRRSDFRLPAALADSKSQWASYFKIPTRDRVQRPAIEGILLPAFSAADHLAVYYSLVYRSTYVFNFGAAALAVALALAGLFAQHAITKSWYVAVELVFILAILATWLRGQSRQFHRRWLEYRRLADSLRQMRILAPMGSQGPVDRPGRRFGVDQQDWVDWYVWSLRRLLPLPGCALDQDYLEAMRKTVREVEIAEQLRYHRANDERMARLDHRLHSRGRLLFLLTAACCGLFVVLAWSGVFARTLSDSDAIRHLFTFLTAFFPTLGAALGAIHAQGDFKSVAEQSERAAKRLEGIDAALRDEEPLTFARLADRIETTSDIMMSDLLEWQTVFRSRPLSLPA